MTKKRAAWVLTMLLVLATVVLIVTLLTVKYLRDHKQRAAPPVTAPPPIATPLPEKSKEPDKPKEPVKPPKQAVPKVRVDEDLAGKVRLCPESREAVAIASDGRLLGHHPYADANATDLGSSPAGFSAGSCSQLHGEAKVALDQLMAAARATDPAIADAMIGLSCFRSAKYQREVFCRKVSDGFAVRARASAPPGYSEHATGYALDFGDRNNSQCNLSACFATTPVGEWLAGNANQYGFVLSFPKGNGQGVMYEPWHWRYQGSPTAQTVFAGAN